MDIVDVPNFAGYFGLRMEAMGLAASRRLVSAVLTRAARFGSLAHDGSPLGKVPGSLLKALRG